MTPTSKNGSGKSWMRCPGNTYLADTALTVLIVGILLSGCARRPWTEPLEGERREAVETAFRTALSAWDRCLPGSDSELAVSWKAPTQTYAFTAYCQLLEPSYLKLTVTSPLGLPLMIIATDAQTYQFLDASKKRSITGNLGSWAAHHNIPPALMNGPWISWLTGRAALTPSQIADIRLDERNRGAWLKITGNKREQLPEEFILFNSETDRITKRMLMDDVGRVRSVISYGRWQQLGDCPRPTEITITGLPYNASAELLFSDIEQTRLAPADFILAVPPSFQKMQMD